MWYLFLFGIRAVWLRSETKNQNNKYNLLSNISNSSINELNCDNNVDINFYFDEIIDEN